MSVTTLTLGLRPRQKAYKGASQDQVWESHSHAPRVQKNVRERNLTLPSELPCWELESRWTPKCLKSDCKGQNAMAQKYLYIIRKLLKHRCLKCARITHLDIWNTSYGQKKGRESNWQFDSRPLKVRNWLEFLVCRWHAKYHWKALHEGYNFVSDLVSIRGLYTKLWGSKVAKVLTLTILGLSLGNRGTKIHLDVGLVERQKVYYKGEGGGCLQIRAVVNLVNPSCPWFILAPKVFKLCTNHLVLVLCGSVWVVDACHSS